MARYSKEEATRVLNDNSGMDKSHREYWLAIVNETLPRYYLTEFLRKRDDYSNDLPDVDVRTLLTTQGKRSIAYKCQGNYLTGLGSSLQAAIKDGIITDGNVIASIDLLLSSDLNFTVGDLNNKDRINRINDTLNQTIEHIQAI